MNIAYLVIGVLLLLGGLYAFRHTQNYLKLNTGSKTTTSNHGGALACGLVTSQQAFLLL